MSILVNAVEHGASISKARKPVAKGAVGATLAVAGAAAGGAAGGVTATKKKAAKAPPASSSSITNTQVPLPGDSTVQKRAFGVVLD